MREFEQLSGCIQSMINECALEKDLIKTKYETDPDSLELSSCSSKFKYYGNHHQTFELLSKRFKDRTKAFELAIEKYDEDDCNRYTGTVWLTERSTIKVVV